MENDEHKVSTLEQCRLPLSYRCSSLKVAIFFAQQSAMIKAVPKNDSFLGEEGDDLVQL